MPKALVSHLQFRFKFTSGTVAMSMPRSLIAAAFVVVLSIGKAEAQGYNPPTGPPAVSPYLNLLQLNSQGIIPYDTLVRPQIETQNRLNQQGATLNQLQRAGSVGASGSQRPTGHPAFFMNYSHFFPAKRR